jgi:hypothetical protein
MQVKHLCGFVLIAMGAVCGFAGCGVGGSEIPPLVPVTGTVLVDGEPAAGVNVTFNPTADTKSTGASGTTGPDGKYELMHRSGELGVEPGSYVVFFSRYMMPSGEPVPAGQSPTESEAVESLPERYRNPEAAIEKATVPAEGGSFDFEVSTN